jgi:tRNA(Phe) wybutosine-synthesizing methylase Tyw3
MSDLSGEQPVIPFRWLQKLGKDWQYVAFDSKIFSLKKLLELEGKEYYQVRISNIFAVLENLNDYIYLNRAWQTIHVQSRKSAEQETNVQQVARSAGLQHSLLERI